MDFTGKCIKVLPPLSGISARTGDTWHKYSFVIETGGEFSKRAVFTVFGEDRWKQMGIVAGAEYQVSFDIDAREYNGKWYNDVSAWRAVRVDGNGRQKAQSKPAARQEPQSPVAEVTVSASGESGNAYDMPF